MCLNAEQGGGDHRLAPHASTARESPCGARSLRRMGRAATSQASAHVCTPSGRQALPRPPAITEGRLACALLLAWTSRAQQDRLAASNPSTRSRCCKRVVCSVDHHIDGEQDGPAGAHSCTRACPHTRLLLCACLFAAQTIASLERSNMALEGQLESEQSSMARLVQEHDAKMAEAHAKMTKMQVWLQPTCGVACRRVFSAGCTAW